MVYTSTRCNRKTCCDILLCRDTKCCACFIPKSAGDSRRLIWAGAFILFVAVLFLLSGIVLPPMLRTAFHEAMINAPILDAKSPTFELFEDNQDFPLQLPVYVYTVLNADDVVKNGAKAELKEIGPFHYNIYRTAIDIEWVDRKRRLDWKYYVRYEFDRSKSVLDDTHEITTVNLPFFGIATTLINWDKPDILKYAVGELQKDNGPYSDETNMAFVTLSVKEVLFGYNDPFLGILHNLFPSLIPEKYTGLLSHHDTMADAQEQLPDGLYTGQGNRRDARYYYKFQGKTTLNEPGTPCFWNNNPDLCTVRGSDGGAFGAPLNSTLDYPLFVSSFMRTVDLEYRYAYKRNGVELYRYEMSPKVFQNKVDNPINADFYIDSDGILPMAPALGDLPLFITLPRYAGVNKDDPFLSTTNIEFIEESNLKDVVTYFDIEPRTSATLNVASTSMLTYAMRPVTYEIEPDDDDDWFKLQFQSRMNSQSDDTTTVHDHNQTQSLLPKDKTSCSFSPFSPISTQSCLKRLEQINYDRPSPSSPSMRTSQTVETITYFGNMLDPLNIPIFWANQYVTVSDDDLSTLARLFRAADNTVLILPIICFVAASLFFLCASFLVCRGWKYNKSYTTDGHVLYETPNAESYTPHKGYHESLDALDLDPIYATDFNATPTKYNRRGRAVSSDRIRSPYSRSYGGLELPSSVSAIPPQGQGKNYTSIVISDD